MNLSLENERIRDEMRSKKKISLTLVNELNIERKINERMMKSQEDINQLNDKSHYRKKGKVGIGYIEEGESSKQGTQKNQRPTFSHCGKIGHTSNKC